jgi:hypothetical protein
MDRWREGGRRRGGVEERERETWLDGERPIDWGRCMRVSVRATATRDGTPPAIVYRSHIYIYIYIYITYIYHIYIGTRDGTPPAKVAPGIIYNTYY